MRERVKRANYEYSKKRLRIASNSFTLDSHERTTSSDVTPLSSCSRSDGDPARTSHGLRSCSYSYGGSRQLHRSRSAAREEWRTATDESTGRDGGRSRPRSVTPA